MTSWLLVLLKDIQEVLHLFVLLEAQRVLLLDEVDYLIPDGEFDTSGGEFISWYLLWKALNNSQVKHLILN